MLPLMRAGFVTSAVFLTLCLGGLARATQDATAHLENARVCYAAVDFECAERELAEARARLSALRPELAREVLALSAETALAEQRATDARAHLTALLALARDFAAPGWPPAWQALLAEVRAALPDRDPPRIEVELPAAIGAGEALTVRVRAVDPSGVGRVVVFWAGPPPGSLELATRDSRVWEGRVSASGSGGPMAVWFEAYDLQGNGPARQGSAQAPLRVEVRAVPEPEAYQTWWFWTAVAVGTAALAGGLYWLSQPGDPATVVQHGALEVQIAWPPSN